MKLCLKKFCFFLVFACSLAYSQEDNSVAADNAAEPVDANVFIEEKPSDEKMEIKAEESGEDKILTAENVAAGNEIPETEGGDESADSSISKANLSLIQLYGERPEVEYWRKVYLSEKWQKVLRGILENAVEYRVYVRKCVQEKEVPPELEYLPVVESGYKTAVR